MNAVDGDPIGGLCTVGATDLFQLGLAVFGPLCLYLVLGSLLLVAGFVALLRIRSLIKLQTQPMLGKSERLERLMLRIGVFGALYTLPTVVLLACLAHELRNRELWQLGQACRCVWRRDVDAMTRLDEEVAGLGLASGHGLAPVLALDSARWRPPKPEFAVVMLKYFSGLLAGLTAGGWICSQKTLTIWRAAFRRRRGRGRAESTRRLPPPPPRQAGPELGQSGLMPVSVGLCNEEARHRYRHQHQHQHQHQPHHQHQQPQQQQQQQQQYLYQFDLLTKTQGYNRIVPGLGTRSSGADAPTPPGDGRFQLQPLTFIPPPPPSLPPPQSTPGRQSSVYSQAQRQGTSSAVSMPLPAPPCLGVATGSATTATSLVDAYLFSSSSLAGVGTAAPAAPISASVSADANSNANANADGNCDCDCGCDGGCHGNDNNNVNGSGDGNADTGSPVGRGVVASRGGPRLGFSGQLVARPNKQTTGAGLSLSSSGFVESSSLKVSGVAPTSIPILTPASGPGTVQPQAPASIVSSGLGSSSLQDSLQQTTQTSLLLQSTAGAVTRAFDNVMQIK
ncbi:unnamed protein product [Protopolystoma xenopodis]|uniref:G-protein coupled receptors family 2 profile 2 domain-containing protein n=1 Tax=Protopolystoma xenopodis TaxID=117903 RepID=A0A3S5APV8_9PLAT|nr:unnamed protein product [Protopolystoma xenopodis]